MMWIVQEIANPTESLLGVVFRENLVAFSDDVDIDEAVRLMSLDFRRVGQIRVIDDAPAILSATGMFYEFWDDRGYKHIFRVMQPHIADSQLDTLRQRAEPGESEATDGA